MQTKNKIGLDLLIFQNYFEKVGGNEFKKNSFETIRNIQNEYFEFQNIWREARF